MMKSSKFVAFMLLGCITVASLTGCGAKSGSGSDSGVGSGSKGLLGGSSKKELSLDIGGEGKSVNFINNIADLSGQMAKQGYGVLIGDVYSPKFFEITSNGKLPEMDAKSGRFANSVNTKDIKRDVIVRYSVDSNSVKKAEEATSPEELESDNVKYADIVLTDIISSRSLDGYNASDDIKKFFPEIKADVASKSEYVDGEAIVLNGDRVENWEEIIARKGLFIFENETGVLYFDDKRVTGEDYLDAALVKYKEELETASASGKSIKANLAQDYFRMKALTFSTKGSRSDLGVFVAAEMLQDGFDKLHNGEIEQITCVKMWSDADEQGKTTFGFNGATIYRLYEKDLVAGIYGEQRAEKMSNIYK